MDSEVIIRAVKEHKKSHEASAHFESCRNVLARHGIYIPDPNPNWKEDANEQGHKTE